MYYIYKITNTINNKIYIGQTVDIKRRFNNHKNNKKSVISMAINKYGINNFTFEIIDKAETVKESDTLEIKYINQFNTISPNGYNIANGGRGGNKFKGKTKEELDIIKNKIATKMKEIRLLDNPFKNKHHSNETKKYLSKINKGENNPNAKPREYYEEKPMCRSNFKKVCQRRNWNFEDFEEINSGLKNKREILYYYKYISK